MSADYGGQLAGLLIESLNDRERALMHAAWLHGQRTALERLQRTVEAGDQAQVALELCVQDLLCLEPGRVRAREVAALAIRLMNDDDEREAA